VGQKLLFWFQSGHYIVQNCEMIFFIQTWNWHIRFNFKS